MLTWEEIEEAVRRNAHPDYLVETLHVAKFLYDEGDTFTDTVISNVDGKNVAVHSEWFVKEENKQ